jgi:hypothetical protein
MTTPVESDAAASWRGLLRASLILLIAGGVLVLAYVQVPIPPIIVFVLLFGVVLYLLSREGRARTIGTVLGGVGALLFLLTSLPFVTEDVAHPDSGLSFIASATGIVGSLLGFVAMLGALLKWGPAPVRPLAGVGGVAVVAVVAIGTVAWLTAESDDREPGDVLVVAEDVDYLPPDAGDVDAEDDIELTLGSSGAVFVDNKDLYRHTFTIDALDLNAEVPAAKDRRVVIDAEPGKYEFYCEAEGHDQDMRGTLVVE